MFHIPVRPDYRDEWDLYTVDEVRSPYPPVSAARVRIRRLAQEAARREQAAQRRAERRFTFQVVGFILTGASVSAVVEWAVYTLAVHS